MSDETWSYVQDGRQQGPITLDDLRALLQAGSLPPDTLVWRPGFDTWLPAERVQELAPHVPPSLPLSAAPPVPPPASLPAAPSPIVRKSGLIRRAFQFKGRFNPGEFAKVALPVIGINLVLNCGFRILEEVGKNDPSMRQSCEIIGGLLALVFIPWFLFSIPLLIGAVRQRLHDLDRTGWWSLMLLLPCLNLALLLGLLARASVPPGSTRWG